MSEKYNESSKYTKAELQAMAQSFLGMLHANVDHRPRDIVQYLAVVFQMSPQLVWQKINDLANLTYTEESND